MSAISDREAKKIFLNPAQWPRYTKVFSFDNSYWLQCRPKRKGPTYASVTFPHLYTAGSKNFWIDPDCLYIRLSGSGNSVCCDVIAVEVSNAQQNFQQKRGRYIGTEAAIFVNLPIGWLRAPVEVNKRYEQYLFADEASAEDRKIPVRTLRVMYFLDPGYFGKKDRIQSVDPRPWEFFLPNTSIKSLTSASMRGFVRAISPDAQFYGWH